MTKTFPERLKHLMRLRHETQQALADAVGVQRQSVSLYLHGQRRPDYDVFQRIAEHYGVSMDYLACRETDAIRWERRAIKDEIVLDIVLLMKSIYEDEQ